MSIFDIPQQVFSLVSGRVPTGKKQDQDNHRRGGGHSVHSGTPASMKLPASKVDELRRENKGANAAASAGAKVAITITGAPGISPEEVAKLKQKNEEFRKVMAERVEHRMYRNGLRTSGERNKYINELYSAFKSGKEFTAEEIDERIAEANKLGDLADVLERARKLEAGAADKLAGFRNDGGIDATTGQLLLASTEGGSSTPEPGSELEKEVEKKKRKFWLEQASLVLEQEESKTYRNRGWKDATFTEWSMPTMLEVPDGEKVEDYYEPSGYVVNGHGNELTKKTVNPDGQFRNGRISSDALAKTSDGGMLETKAAAAWEAMVSAAAAEGIKVSASDHYRDYQGQVNCKASWTARGRPEMAATPGHSNHGLGGAVDMNNCGDYNTPTFKWLKENAWKFGWNHPHWAREGGSKNEPWHWEYIGTENTAVAKPRP